MDLHVKCFVRVISRAILDTVGSALHKHPQAVVEALCLAVGTCMQCDSCEDVRIHAPLETVHKEALVEALCIANPLRVEIVRSVAIPLVADILLVMFSDMIFECGRQIDWFPLQLHCMKMRYLTPIIPSLDGVQLGLYLQQWPAPLEEENVLDFMIYSGLLRPAREADPLDLVPAHYCCMCMQHPVDIILEPCKHHYVCSACVSAVCPVCKEQIGGYRALELE